MFRVERCKSTKTAACFLAQANRKRKRLFSSLNCICITFFKNHVIFVQVHLFYTKYKSIYVDLLIIQQIREILYIYIYIYSTVLISA